MAEPRIGVGAAIVRDGRLLLVRRLRAPEIGCWSFPGGKIDWMEPVETALRREIREEIGLDLGSVSLLCVTDQIDPAAGTHWVAPVYLAMQARGEPANLEPEKHAAVAWCDPAALPSPLSLAVREALPHLLRALGECSGD